ncbi:MAG: hypothetical protein VW338_03440 [Rhodospirillaceae bacterium]
MAKHLQLFWNITDNQLVRGFNDPTPYVLPKQFFESKIALDITVVRKKAGGGFAAPFEYVGNAEPLAAAIGTWSGTTGTKLAFQNSWTTTGNVYQGTLDFNTVAMTTAMGSSQAIDVYFELEWDEGYTFQQPVKVSGEVITAGSPQPLPTDLTDKADLVEAVLADSDSINMVRTANVIKHHVIPDPAGRVIINAGQGVDVSTPLVEIGGTQGLGVVAIAPAAKYRVIVANYDINGITSSGNVDFQLSATGRQEGDLCFLHVNASSLTAAAVTITTDSTADLSAVTNPSNPLSLNCVLYFDGTIWALLSAVWNDGTLASGTFTPTYPAAASAADETEIATKSPSAAGSEDWTPDKEKTHSVLHITPGVGAGAYTYDYFLQRPAAGGEPAPFVVVYCDMPASNNPTIRIYDEGPAGGSGDDVLLETFVGTIRSANKFALFLLWTGSEYEPILRDSDARALGYHPLFVPGSALTARDDAGAVAASTETSGTKTMLKTMSFAGDVDRFAQFLTDSPGGWDLSDVMVQIVWVPKEAGSTGDTVLALQAKCIGDNVDPDSAWSTVAQVVDTVQTVGRLHRSAWFSATVANAAVGAATFFQLIREATDVLDTIHDGASGAVAVDILGVRVLFKLTELNDNQSSKTNP